MKERTRVSLLAFFLAFTSTSSLFAADGTIKLGVTCSTTGSFAEVGVSTINTAQLAAKEINAEGGIKIGNKSYLVELAIVDNGSDRSAASANILKLISQEKIIALVGPQSSDRAIAVGEIANSFKTPMVSPWSTSPLTTLNRPYVFRMAVLYDIQGVTTTKLAAKEWKATKAAILYDEMSPYPTGMAKAFKASFESVNGPGSIVAFETFRTGDKDFNKQLAAIINSGADFLYTPQHYQEVPLIVHQAKAMGWKKPITGSNSWAGGDLMELCGAECKGMFFTGNFAAGGTKGKAKIFVDTYQKTYNKLPDEPAALTYDAIKFIAQALKNTGGLTGNIILDRKNLRDQLAVTKNFEGVTSTMSFQGNGDPIKCAVIIKIDENGLFTTYETVCP